MVKPVQQSSNSIRIFDRDLLRQRQKRSAGVFSNHNFLHRWSAELLEERLNDIRREFKTTLHIDPSRPHSTVTLENTDTPKKIQINMDEEFLPFAPSSLDLLTSNLNLHTVNDLPGALIQIRRALKPDGLFLAAMFGGQTLHELRQSLMQTEMELRGGLSPRVHPFADKQDMGALMQRAGFALPVVDSENLTVTYDNMFALIRDLRGMGETNIIAERDITYPGRSFFPKAAEYYQNHFSEDNGSRIRATFEIIFLIGWAPHDSQQTPLKPGSATNRLADALGSEEIKTGETP